MIQWIVQEDILLHSKLPCCRELHMHSYCHILQHRSQLISLKQKKLHTETQHLQAGTSTSLYAYILSFRPEKNIITGQEEKSQCHKHKTGIVTFSFQIHGNNSITLKCKAAQIQKQNEPSKFVHWIFCWHVQFLSHF